MQDFSRTIQSPIDEALGYFPAVCLTGPRQCGKTSLAKRLGAARPDSVYLDLERPADRRRLEDADAYLESLAGRLVILDEVQHLPDLFPVLRGLIDRDRRPGRFLLLGSVSPQLLRQSRDSLAGRLANHEMAPLRLVETGLEHQSGLWQRGGFPGSLLAPSERLSRQWRDQYLRNFLERDLPQLGFRVPAETLRRFWTMAAHLHGQQLNLSQLGQSLGCSHTAIRNYLDMLAQTYMLREIPAWSGNLAKRLVKSPKLYLRDSGLLHSLLGIADANDLLGHPVCGASWEGFLVEEILAATPEWQASYYRTSAGAEIDLVLERGQERLAFEFKLNSAPQVSAGFWHSLEDLKPKNAYVIAPVPAAFPLRQGVQVLPPQALLEVVKNL